MLRALPIGLKTLVPGYRGRHLRAHAVLLAEIVDLAPRLRYGGDDAPWIEIDGDNVRLHGFATDHAAAEQYEILKPALPAGLPRSHFRLVKDYVTRWRYPHMRPDLRPEGADPAALQGFHGQHRDDVSTIGDPAARARLAAAFRPSASDVVVDCGAFLGFGAIRMGRDAPAGRVFAIEASADCVALLRRNVESCRASNVVALHRGVWNTVGTMPLETNFAQANSLVAEVQAGAARQSVQTITIDALVAEYRLDRVDMVSLTLNGAEVEAVAGAVNTLAKFRPRVRAAGWYRREGHRIADLVAPLLERAQYDVFVGPHGNVMALPREGVHA